MAMDIGAWRMGIARANLTQGGQAALRPIPPPLNPKRKCAAWKDTQADESVIIMIIEHCALARTRPADKRERIVVSRDTGKRYRVIREYRHTLLVRPAWKQGGLPFTLPRECFTGTNMEAKI